MEKRKREDKLSHVGYQEDTLLENMVIQSVLCATNLDCLMRKDLTYCHIKCLQTLNVSTAVIFKRYFVVYQYLNVINKLNFGPYYLVFS